MPQQQHPRPTIVSSKVSSIAFKVILALALLLAVCGPAQRAYAQAVPIEYEHFNTELTLHEDGMLHVRLVQQIRFDGEFSGAFYAIPLENVTAISNVQLFGATTEQANYELDTVDLAPLAPNYIENNGDEVFIDWNFPETRRGDVRLFVIEYDAFGVTWVYPQEDFISWKAVGEDRSGITVNESEVKLTLPEIIPMDQVTTTDNFGGDMISVTGQTITYIAGDPIPDGASFIVEAHFPHGLLDVGVRQWQREVDGDLLRVEIDRFDTDITINQDGTLSVSEQTALTVLEGALHQGSRSLKLLYLDEVGNPSVAINGQPLDAAEADCTNCYQINVLAGADNWVYLDPTTEQLTINEDNSGSYNIDWYTPLPIQAGERITTTIAYQAAGVLRIAPENQLLTWQVVPDFGIPARQASMRLTLPPGINAEQITLEGPNEQGTPQVQPDGSLLYRFDGPVVPGAWQISLTLPANATRATAPLWQEKFEEVMAQADAAAVTRARNTLISRVIGGLAIVGAILAAIYSWFRWGRRKVKETLGGYLSAPPSRQSPAMVAFLVDRKASERAVLGTIFYLASFKLLEIDLEGEIKLRRLHNEPLHSTSRLTDVYGETVALPRHVTALFDRVLLPGLPQAEWASLDSLAPLLRANLPEIYSVLASDLQTYFIGIPGSDNDAVPGSMWFTIYAILLGLMFFEIIPWFIGFGLGFVVLLIFVIWSATQQTSKGGYTDAGALEADRWRRFRTYLLEIKKYGDQGAAQEIIDRYFGYAVALGVENVLLAQAADMGTTRPVWMPRPSIFNRPDHEPIREPRDPTQPTINFLKPRPRPTTQADAPQPPTLAGMSVQLGKSISQASRNLGALLATAAGDADSVARKVTVNSQLRRREMEWQPNTPVTSILDDIMRQSVADAREVQAREIARRTAARSASRQSSGGGNWGGGSSSSSSTSSRSSSSFGRSSSSSRRSSSSSRSSSSRSRSSGGGRSGFR